MAPNSTITVEFAATLPLNLGAYDNYEPVFSDEPPGTSIDNASIALAIDREILVSDDYTVQLTPAGALAVATPAHGCPRAPTPRSPWPAQPSRPWPPPCARR